VLEIYYINLDIHSPASFRALRHFTSRSRLVASGGGYRSFAS
jgi:hypothetical protein